MVDPLLIIKFGGSVITDKDSTTPKMNSNVIDSLCMQLAQIYKNFSKRIVLVHGAGSYGHPIAKKFKLKAGVFNDEQKLAMTEINLLMNNLNSYMVEKLISSDIPTVSLAPHAFILQDNAYLTSLSTTLIKSYLDLEIIPILYGDMVLDKEINGSVLSGDTIVPYLGQELGASQVIFVSDVDGIFDSNPKTNPDAQLISEVTSSNIDQIMGAFTQHNEHDVSGEMAGKIQSIRQRLAGIPVYIVNGQKPMVLQDLVTEQVHSGTKLLL